MKKKDRKLLNPSINLIPTKP